MGKAIPGRHSMEVLHFEYDTGWISKRSSFGDTIMIRQAPEERGQGLHTFITFWRNLTICVVVQLKC
jgi:hypothetical protein